MPSSSFILHPSSFRAKRIRAFTLLELLVVIGIIVGLMALLTPMVIKARKQASRTRQASDLHAIATALDEYKHDFGEYPRASPLTGLSTLGWALMSPGPATVDASFVPHPPNYDATRVYHPGELVFQSPTIYAAMVRTSTSLIGDTPIAPATPPGDYWEGAPWADGNDGPGFRTRLGQGEPHRYLQPDRFKLRGYAILDIWGNAILYFPARAGQVNINKPNPIPPGQLPTYVWDTRDTSLPNPRPLFNVSDNLCVLGGKFTQPYSAGVNVAAREKLQVFLGDTDKDGYIGAGETAATIGPFILWSAGPDADGVLDPLTGNVHYGLDPKTGKTDDVTNFDLPPALLK